MEQVVQPQAAAIRKPDYLEAWNLVSGQLHGEMSRAQFETWVQPLKPLGYADRVFRLGAVNSFTQEWVESRLKNRVTALLSGMLNETVTLRVVVVNGTSDAKAKKVSAHAAVVASPPKPNRRNLSRLTGHNHNENRPPLLFLSVRPDLKFPLRSNSPTKIYWPRAD